MKRVAILIVALLLLGTLGSQALAGPPERYRVEFQLVPGPPDFTSGEADPAYVCPLDADSCEETALDIGTVSSRWSFRPGFPDFRTVHGEHTFTSHDGSSFTVRFQAVPDPTGQASLRENWSVADGSGRYAELRGSGHGTVTRFFVSVALNAVNAEF